MISKNDLFGIFSVSIPNGERLDSYHRTLHDLRPLFQDKEFISVVTGFYLNRIKKDHSTVRISYFVSRGNEQRAARRFIRFFEENRLLFLETEKPQAKTVAASYGGPEFEERFRSFLAIETRIGLEIMERDLLQAQRLLAVYRFQVPKQYSALRHYFEEPLGQLSPTYNSLSDDAKYQFLTDLCRFDWGHFLVNLVLGCDWSLSTNQPLSIPQVNDILRRTGIGFEIPLDWKP